MKEYKGFKIELVKGDGEFEAHVYNGSGKVKITHYVGKTAMEAVKQAEKYVDKCVEQ